MPNSKIGPPIVYEKIVQFVKRESRDDPRRLYYSAEHFSLLRGSWISVEQELEAMLKLRIERNKEQNYFDPEDSHANRPQRLSDVRDSQQARFLQGLSLITYGHGIETLLSDDYSNLMRSPDFADFVGRQQEWEDRHIEEIRAAMKNGDPV